MVTTGGLVRKGNPDKQVSANAVRYHRHTVSELESLSPTDWEAYHAGYFNHIVNSNPNYILPLSFLRDLERQGRVGKVHEHIYALPGVSTPVAVSAGHGRSIAADLKAGGVDGALLVAT
jgi:glycine reductase